MTPVKFDRLSVTVEVEGVRLCLEGLVPPELWPDLNAGSQPECRARALAQISEAFPALIPAPILRQIQRQGSGQSGHVCAAHSGNSSQKHEASAPSELCKSDDTTVSPTCQSSI